MVNQRTLTVYIKDEPVFAYVRTGKEFKFDDIELVIIDEILGE